MTAHWTFHATRAAALAVAPLGRPFTVVNAAVPVRPHPSPVEYLHTRPVLDTPYPKKPGRPRRWQ
jgi:hypothetical protein